MKGYIGQFYDEIHGDGVYRFEWCLNRLERVNWSLVSASISIIGVVVGDVFIDEMSFPFKMKMLEILYHSVMFKVMLLIMRFCQDFGDQCEWNHQVLCFVDVMVIEEVVCNSKWVAGLRSVENVLVLSSVVRFQVLYDFVVDVVGFIAIGELLVYLVCDLCF